MCEDSLLNNVNYIDFLNKLKNTNSQIVLNALYYNLENKELYKKLKVLYALISLLEENILITEQLQQFTSFDKIQEYSKLINEINKENK